MSSQAPEEGQTSSALALAGWLAVGVAWLA